MADTKPKDEAERAPSLKRSRDDCCSNDDSPEPQQNLKGDTSSVAVTKSRENTHDFDQNERPTGLVFDEAAGGTGT